MSRIGNLPIPIPNSVKVEKNINNLAVLGQKGSLSLNVHPAIEVEVKEDKIFLRRRDDSKKSKALHGLMRSLIANMVTGVDKGWSKTVELQGVGFRVVKNGEKLTLSLGFSHPIEISAPKGIQFDILDNTKIAIFGIDKYLVGQVAANIRKIRPPDPYKGKGVRYEGEYVRKKPGKAGKMTGVGGGL